MKQHVLERHQTIPRPVDEVFAFFAQAENLETLTPDFLRFRILTPTPITIAEGTRIDYALSLFRVPVRWRTHITLWEPGRRFIDVQEKGPFSLWRHLHEFEVVGGATRMRDQVTYAEPFGPLGTLAHHMTVKRLVERIFEYRYERIVELMGARPDEVQMQAVQ